MSCHHFYPLRYAERVCVVMKHQHVEQFWIVRHDLSVGGQSKYGLLEWLEHSAKIIITDPQFLTFSMTSWYKPSIAAFSLAATIAVEKDKSISQEYKPVVSTQIKCPQRLLPNPCCRWIWQSLLCDCKGRDHSHLDQVRRSLGIGTVYWNQDGLDPHKEVAQCFLLFWMDSHYIRWLLMGKRSELRAKTPPLEKLGMIDGVDLLKRTFRWVGVLCWFQERALLFDEPRSATVQADQWWQTVLEGLFQSNATLCVFSLRNREMTFIRDFAAWQPYQPFCFVTLREIELKKFQH